MADGVLHEDYQRRAISSWSCPHFPGLVLGVVVESESILDRLQDTLEGEHLILTAMYRKLRQVGQ